MGQKEENELKHIKVFNPEFELDMPPSETSYSANNSSEYFNVFSDENKTVNIENFTNDDDVENSHTYYDDIEADDSKDTFLDKKNMSKR